MLSLAILGQITDMAKARAAKVSFILITLVALLTPISIQHYYTLCQVAVNKANLTIFKGDQLLDATSVASLV